MKNLIIESDKDHKGRSFQATLVASIDAPAMWAAGSTARDVSRPVWAVLAGTETELRPFVANLRMGRKAVVSGRHRSTDKVEFLKSVKFQWSWSRYQDGAIVQVFWPELFRLSPGLVDPNGVEFICAPSRDYLARQQVDESGMLTHLEKVNKVLATDERYPLEKLVGLGSFAWLFCAYLDGRTRAPLIQDGRFYMQIMARFLQMGLANWPASNHHYNRQFGEMFPLLSYYGEEDSGLARPMAMRASHQDIETVLAEEVSRYFALV